jgi:hypothetical protein
MLGRRGAETEKVRARGKKRRSDGSKADGGKRMEGVVIEKKAKTRSTKTRLLSEGRRRMAIV